MKEALGADVVRDGLRLFCLSRFEVKFKRVANCSYKWTELNLLVQFSSV